MLLLWGFVGVFGCVFLVEGGILDRGTKDNLLSNMTPRILVSSTTGIGLLSRKIFGSKWRPPFWHVYIQTLFVLENQRPLSVAHC